MLAECQKLKEKKLLFHKTIQKAEKGVKDQRKEIRVAQRQLIIEFGDYHAKFGEQQKEKATEQRKVEKDRRKHAVKGKELEEDISPRDTSNELRNIIDGLMGDLDNEKEECRILESDRQSLHQAQVVPAGHPAF
ncbi:hypothetical protein CAEBREN_15096 [Caenorhabditis brenneri]|uniref:Uncharacterized protein n=1 Tax=Caenorhabditis brenneri TaxID=135651 RepID=G0P3U7_CAEBE|nr:hypothetical protein CAEBREN_15096 [Caenorhabditis brenneri]